MENKKEGKEINSNIILNKLIQFFDEILLIEINNFSNSIQTTSIISLFKKQLLIYPIINYIEINKLNNKLINNQNNNHSTSNTTSLTTSQTTSQSTPPHNNNNNNININNSTNEIKQLINEIEQLKMTQLLEIEEYYKIMKMNSNKEEEINEFRQEYNAAVE